MSPDEEAAMLVELMLVGGGRAMTADEMLSRLPFHADIPAILAKLTSQYEGRGFMLAEVQPGRYAIRTRPETSDLCRMMMPRTYRMSPAAMQTLAVIAYCQPVTRGEIEKVRGVALSKGTLDILIFAGWVRPGPRRASPGAPMTFVTTDAFLQHFNLRELDDLPDIARLREEGLLDPAAGLDMAPRREVEED